MEQQMTLDQRMELMRQDSKVNADDLEEYKKTELLRKSVNDVKARAQANRQRRESPSKAYSNAPCREYEAKQEGRVRVVGEQKNHESDAKVILIFVRTYLKTHSWQIVEVAIPGARLTPCFYKSRVHKQ